jgi:2-polyprenyl-3-methyl-5-hydroxy-6-metoxy-1,4-benzoquinol methylase
VTNQEHGQHVSDRWAEWRRQIPLQEYHSRWERMDAEGKSTHGEADFIEALHPRSVLDAGCGMGRVAIELHRRGIEVEGADLDDDLLAFARGDAPHITWHHADLSELALDRRFDVVAMPGNVMLFCRPEHRCPIVASLAEHLQPDGLLVAGFSLDRHPEALTLAEYDACCSAAGLTLHERFSTWERDPYDAQGYSVSVHRSPLRNG